MLKLEGLVALPWSMGERSGVSFRASKVESTGVAGGDQREQGREAGGLTATVRDGGRRACDLARHVRALRARAAAPDWETLGQRSGGAVALPGRAGADRRAGRVAQWVLCRSAGRCRWRALVVLVRGRRGCWPGAAGPPAHRHGPRSRARVRRAWERAVIDAGAARGPLQGPRVRSVQPGGGRRAAAGAGARAAPRSPSWTRGAISSRRACACVRCAWSAIEPTAAVAEVMLVRRDPFEDPAPLPWPHAGRGAAVVVGAGAGRRRRARRALAIGLVERNVLSAASPARASPPRCRCSSPPRRWIRGRGCGCWTASWSSWRCGRRSPSSSPAPTATRRS